MDLLQSVHHLLCCPDDGGALRRFPDRLVCDACSREFRVDGNFVSLLAGAAAPLEGDTTYRRYYLAARSESEGGPVAIRGWRLPPGGPPHLFQRKARQVEAARRLLEEGAPSLDVVCDFSAGTGYFTLTFARSWQTVIHCDLCLDSLCEAREQARRDRLDNVLFVRMDYLRPPFRASLPRILCLGSLCRSAEHEQALLRSILGAVGRGGFAVVDFHNWWHNPLRRVGLMPNNLGENRSYSRRELDAVLARAGVRHYERFPFRQESAKSRFVAMALRGLPPTHWIFRIHHAAPSHSRAA